MALPAWTEAGLRPWYAEHPPDLSWLGRPQRHLFRWRSLDGLWRTAPRRLRTGAQLARTVAAHPPVDLYVGTAAWLDPVRLPRLRDPDARRAVLLDHLVVFDIDRPPFSLQRLERARADTAALAAWLERETDLERVHVAFSGSKGFHLVLRDPDRSPFAEPDPVARERAVQAARRRLLARVVAAGHAVDEKVTADTRRILRLPGSLHGSTGWQCSVLEPGLLHRPVREWIAQVARHPSARPLPPRPPTLHRLRDLRHRLSGRAARRRGTGTAPRRDEPVAVLQASTHVAGTPDRGAWLAWLPRAWGTGPDARARIDQVLAAAGLGPGLLWELDGRLLVLVPRAVPRPALARHAAAAGLGGFAARLDGAGHAWVDVAPRAPLGRPTVQLLASSGGVLGAAGCHHPWSRPHLDLARRLGHPAVEALENPAQAAGPAAPCGAPHAALRLAVLS